MLTCAIGAGVCAGACAGAGAGADVKGEAPALAAGAGANSCAGAGVKGVAGVARAAAAAGACAGVVNDGLRMCRGDAGVPQCICQKLRSALLVQCGSVVCNNAAGDAACCTGAVT